MVALKEDQSWFLASQGISESAVFDASGMSKRRYRLAMEREEKLFAIGVTPCARGGHTLRSRSGHCIQCNTANIAFIKRFYEEAFVYIADSRSEEVIKIGCSATPWNRESIINQLGYGRIYDWRLLYYAKFADAGKVEFGAHGQL
jgi:hypothetical protein